MKTLFGSGSTADQRRASAPASNQNSDEDHTMYAEHDYTEFTAEYLTESQKRGVAGVCACMLPTVNDGSTDLKWSQTYLKLLVETFLGLPSTQVEAFLPMLTAKLMAVQATRATSPSKANAHVPVEPLDPSPFLSLLTPAEPQKERGLKAWLKKKKKDDNNQNNVGADSASDTVLLSPSMLSTEAFRLKIVKRLLWFTVKSIGYDARARTLLRGAVNIMNIPWKEITKEEVIIGRTLFAEATAMPLEKIVAKPSLWDWKRNIAIGAAAVTGGALLAITGGMAAPAIGAGIAALGGAGVAIGTAIGSAAGVTATTILFGTAGAGVVGMKTDTRTRGVHQFSFDLVTAGDGMNVYICVSGWLDEDDPPARGFRRPWGDSHEYLRAFYRTRNPEKVEQVDQMMDRYKGREDEFFSILRKTYHLEDVGSLENDPLGISSQAVAAADAPGDVASANNYEALRAWRWKDRFPQGDQYCLMWEESMLRKFGKSMRTFAAQQVSNYATNEIVKYTALSTLFAAVAVPRTLLKMADMIDNIWVLAMNAADESGKLLADALRQHEQGLRPVTLVGYGMGARLIYACLKELAKSPDDCCGIVENAVMLGSPVPLERTNWQNARRLVSGRLINGYSENDWMLGIMYRYQGWALNSAGISPIEVEGIENVDLSSIIQGHLEYKNKIGLIMDMIKLEG